MFSANLSIDNISVKKGQSFEVDLNRCIDFEITNNQFNIGEANTIYLNLSKEGRSKNYPIHPGQTVKFSPASDQALYTKPIYLYADVLSNNIVIVKHILGSIDG